MYLLVFSGGYLLGVLTIAVLDAIERIRFTQRREHDRWMELQEENEEISKVVTGIFEKVDREGR